MTASPQRSSWTSSGTYEGREQRSRSTLEFPHGQASLTGLGVVLTLSAALGLEGNPPATRGLYLPEQLSEAEWFLAQLTNSGALIHLDVTAPERDD